MDTMEIPEVTQPETTEVTEASVDQQVETSQVEENLEDTAEQSQDAEQELVEVEFEGKIYQVPPELKNALLRQADYTRKTQEVASLRKAIEAERELLQQSQQQLQQNFNDVIQLAQIDFQLSVFDNVNWSELAKNDPAQSQQMQMSYLKLKEQRDALARQLEQKAAATAYQTQFILSQKLQEEEAKLAKSIPNWSPQTKTELREFAKTIGFTDEEVSSVVDHRLVKLLYYAKAGYNAMQKAKAGVGQVEAKPTSTVKQSPVQAKSPEKMSMEEFVKWRQQQLKRR